MPYQDLYSELELIPIVTFEAKSYNIPCSISEEYRAAYYFSYTLSDGVEEFYKALYRFLSPKFVGNTLNEWDAFVNDVKKNSEHLIDNEGFINFGDKLYLKNPKLSYPKISPFQLIKLVALLNGQTEDELYADTLRKCMYMPSKKVKEIIVKQV